MSEIRLKGTITTFCKVNTGSNRLLNEEKIRQAVSEGRDVMTEIGIDLAQLGLIEVTLPDAVNSVNNKR